MALESGPTTYRILVGHSGRGIKPCGVSEALLRARRGHLNIRILQTSWFLEFHLSWAVEPECRVEPACRVLISEAPRTQIRCYKAPAVILGIVFGACNTCVFTYLNPLWDKDLAWILALRPKRVRQVGFQTP